ncbi:hypothetical protein SAMN04490248_12049 [Salinihabitans flavidus]|uniref:Major tropism determinant N-terminal domain-containing protein n=1 Tax=Salinihabitans flavidus TaxID=569882 RepID=A0A1H8UIZ8_9RHOB|nr:hypothetical protein [Salinihabitans flavidus]SEP03141.1 hypothetical protein SAMN04490248_12049 [Salinihabitans flavidus]
MAIRIKRSAVAGKVPTTTQLDLGELALNTHDGRLFAKRDNGAQSVVEFAGTARTISAGTGLTGGGTLAANRTLSAKIATQAEAEAGTATGKLMTPQRTAQAIAALAAAGGLPGLSAGTAIRSRIDGAVSKYDPVFSSRHRFDFIQFGTIRISVDIRCSHTGNSGDVRILRTRNGSALSVASWAPASTSFVVKTADIAVQPGDRLDVQYRGGGSTTGGKSTTYHYVYLRNVRFKTGGETLLPGTYARLEGNVA